LILGFVGVIFFGAGGAVIANGLYSLQKSGLLINPSTDANLGYVWGFWGFLLIGVGFWFIVMSGKLETKQTPS
jgi:hypothetical protein